jgi:hypothetical protein
MTKPLPSHNISPWLNIIQAAPKTEGKWKNADHPSRKHDTNLPQPTLTPPAEVISQSTPYSRRTYRAINRLILNAQTKQ